MPNPSFETYTSCPTTGGDIPDIWESYGGTPDYYNICAIGSSSPAGVPSNWVGYQNAFDGNGYIGILTYDGTAFNREYIGIPLTQTLSIGTKYFVSANISRADTLPYTCASNRFGFRFSTNTFSISSPVPTNNFSHVNSILIINDTLGWTKVSGSFVSDSLYKYFIIGNFYNDASTATTGCISKGAYYYVDRTCVSTDSMLCNNVTNIFNFLNYDEIFIYPNPVVNSFNIEFLNYYAKCDMVISDMFGIEIFRQKIKEKKTIVNIADFKPGFYNLTILFDNKPHNYKLIKQ